MDRIKKLCKGYNQRDIWNVDESGCFCQSVACKEFSSERKESPKKGQSRGSLLHFSQVKIEKKLVSKPIAFVRHSPDQSDSHISLQVQFVIHYLLVYFQYRSLFLPVGSL